MACGAMPVLKLRTVRQRATSKEILYQQVHREPVGETFYSPGHFPGRPPRDPETRRRLLVSFQQCGFVGLGGGGTQRAGPAHPSALSARRRTRRCSGRAGSECPRTLAGRRVLRKRPPVSRLRYVSRPRRGSGPDHPVYRPIFCQYGSERCKLPRVWMGAMVRAILPAARFQVQPGLGTLESSPTTRRISARFFRRLLLRRGQWLCRSSPQKCGTAPTGTLPLILGTVQWRKCSPCACGQNRWRT